jgi:TM2 domain-containing membrane protein YozV
MEQSKIDAFITAMVQKFPAEKLDLVSRQLKKLDDSKFIAIQSANYKDPTRLLIVSIFGGVLGIDRFMLAETGYGVAKLLTCGGVFVWMIIDWFSIMERTKEYNYQKFIQVAQ